MYGQLFALDLASETLPVCKQGINKLGYHGIIVRSVKCRPVAYDHLIKAAGKPRIPVKHILNEFFLVIMDKERRIDLNIPHVFRVMYVNDKRSFICDLEVIGLGDLVQAGLKSYIRQFHIRRYFDYFKEIIMTVYEIILGESYKKIRQYVIVK